MPQHIELGTSEFEFDLARPADWSFAPGDTIIGHLVRKSHIITPEATITLSFIGRAKNKLLVRRDDSRSTYRDELTLVNSHNVIFTGPLHLAKDSIEPLTWPISTKIPLEPEGSLRRERDLKGSLSHPSEDQPDHHHLPGSFYSGDFGDWESHCFVEYYLTAKLQYRYRGRSHSKTAICPIRVRPVTDTINLKLNQVHLLQDIKVVTSQRLLPGMENADLTFKERIQKLVRHSKVPCFRYSIYLTVPAAIQISNPNPIPLQLGIVPSHIGTSESLRLATQYIRLECIQMCLRTFTDCKAKRPGHPQTLEIKQDFGLQFVFTEPLLIKAGKENGYVHLGDRFQLKLGPMGLQCSENWRLEQNKIRFFPDFKISNIEHYNKVDYTVYLIVGGEKVKHRFTGISTEIIPSE